MRSHVKHATLLWNIIYLFTKSIIMQNIMQFNRAGSLQAFFLENGRPYSSNNAQHLMARHRAALTSNYFAIVVRYTSMFVMQRRYLISVGLEPVVCQPTVNAPPAGRRPPRPSIFNPRLFHIYCCPTLVAVSAVSAYFYCRADWVIVSNVHALCCFVCTLLEFGARKIASECNVSLDWKLFLYARANLRFAPGWIDGQWSDTPCLTCNVLQKA